MVEPLVLLPGIMCDARLYYHQIVRFSQVRPVTVAPTLIGERVEEVAETLLENLPGRFALVGLGLGGAIALEIIRRAPDRVSRLFLMSVDAQADTPQMAASREPLIVKAKAGRLDDVMREVMPVDALAPGPNRNSMMGALVDVAVELGPDVFESQMRLLQRRPDQQSTLRKIKVPTHILCGAHDTLTPMRKQAFIADLIPGALLQVVDEAGHLPTLEAPEAVTEAIEQWLKVPLSFF